MSEPGKRRARADGRPALSRPPPPPRRRPPAPPRRRPRSRACVRPPPAPRAAPPRSRSGRRTGCGRRPAARAPPGRDSAAGGPAAGTARRAWPTATAATRATAETSTLTRAWRRDSSSMRRWVAPSQPLSRRSSRFDRLQHRIHTPLLVGQLGQRILASGLALHVVPHHLPPSVERGAQLGHHRGEVGAGQVARGRFQRPVRLARPSGGTPPRIPGRR